MWSNKTDADLAALVRQGSHQAFAEIVRRHTKTLYLLAYRSLGNKQDAEDIVQSVMLSFWQKPGRWNEEKSQLLTWLYTVVLNACRDLLRRQSSLNKRVLNLISFTASSSQFESEQQRLEQVQEFEQHQRQLLAAISELSMNQRDAINLVSFCDLPQKEVAKIMGVSVKAVESLLVRAKKNLAKSMTHSLSENNDSETNFKFVR